MKRGQSLETTATTGDTRPHPLARCPQMLRLFPYRALQGPKHLGQQGPSKPCPNPQACAQPWREGQDPVKQRRTLCRGSWTGTGQL